VEFLVLDPYLLVVFSYPTVLVMLVCRSWGLRLRAGPVPVIVLMMLLLSHWRLAGRSRRRRQPDLRRFRRG